MENFNDYFAANKFIWNQRTAVHKDSAFYNLEGFKKGEYDEVYIAYTKFLSTISQHAQLMKLIPINTEDLKSENKNEEKKSDLLFQLSIKTIYLIIKSIGKKIDINIHPHSLRHIFATNLLENGAPMQVAQHILGHSSVKTTEMYSHISNNTLNDAFRKYHSVL